MSEKVIGTDYRTLDQLAFGETAQIRDIKGHLQTCLQLMDLGFIPGQSVSMVSRAPFNDPIAIALRGTIIALRRKDASCIII